jgi:ATP-binding cassette subfamily F protein 3
MLIAVNQIRKFFGKQDLLRGANFHIHPGEKMGFVGPNGSGKSTFLRILLGEESLDDGEIHRARHIQIAYLPQDVMSLQGRSVLEQVLEVAEEARVVDREIKSIERELEGAQGEERQELASRLAHYLERYQFLGGYELRPRAEKILTGLGFNTDDFGRRVETLSGGWAMRVALARLLMSDPDLMLLDEPTNHLDLESLCWLENYLTQVSSAVLLISHDRSFLNRLVSRIVEIQDGQLISYNGNFDHYRQEKRKRLELALSAYRVQQEKIRQIERFIERNRVRKDRARQVQSRIRLLEKMERIEPPNITDKISFRFPPAALSGRFLIELENLTFGFDGRLLFSDTSLALRRGDRVALLGANGSGKSTLLRILAGQVRPDRGSRRTGHGVKLAYFAQDQMELLNPEKTVLQEVMDSVQRAHKGELRNLLGGFQFKGDAVFKPVKVLSGGERSRLLLCKVILKGANLLLLDEPTNHLDISSREMLERALQQFEGTICLVTHDRHLMNSVANHILVMREKGWELFPGNYEDYQKIWLKKGSATFAAESGKARRPRRDRERKRKEAEWRNKFYRLKAPIQESIEGIEERVEAATRRVEEIQKEMAAPELYRCPNSVGDLQREHAGWKSKLEIWTKRWEELILELDSLDERMERERPE